MNLVKWEITAGRRNGQYGTGNGNGNGTITVTGDNGKGRLTVVTVTVNCYHSVITAYSSGHAPGTFRADLANKRGRRAGILADWQLVPLPTHPPGSLYFAVSRFSMNFSMLPC